MDLKEIVAPTLKELFIAEIEQKILSGEWKIGDRLPAEREMERKMKVSRTIINSGLAILAQNGFVEVVPRQGAFVGNYIQNGNLDTLLSIMNFNGGKLDKKTFDSLMMYRIHNDCECAYLAAQNRTDDDLILMHSIYKKVMETTDITTISQLKIDFHHAINCATGNSVYPLVYNSFKKLSLNFNEIVFRNFGYKAASTYMLELINAIEKRNPDEARSIMNKLITLRVDNLRQWYYKD
jgi:DNA-binding FadR family transcriptional regulator